MPYESKMQKFAREAIAAHGQLIEVVFLRGDHEDSLLVFLDGTVIPALHGKHGYNIRREHYVFGVAAELSGQDPFEFLRFGYIGTGPKHYSYFLRAAGFRDTDVSVINEPLRLKRDGSKVRGVSKGDLVEWVDGSITSSPSINSDPSGTSVSNHKITKKWYQFWK